MVSDIWIVVPVKPYETGKSRLRLALAERIAVNRAFFEHVLRTAAAVVDPSRVVIVSGSDEILGTARRFGARSVREDGHATLNDSLAKGAAFAGVRGADGVLSLFADLPYLDSGDLTAMIAPFVGGNLIIAPDEAGSGTNALLMAPNALPYRHQSDSFWLHLSAAREASMPFNIVRRSGLMRDIDTPEHFAELSLDSIAGWRAQHHG